MSADKDVSFGKKGVSGSYLIPEADMKVPPESLAGNRLWVILRGREDRIFLCFVIKKIERIIEGYYEDDYLASLTNPHEWRR